MPTPGEVAFVTLVPSKDIKDKGERLRATQKKTTGGTPNENIGVQSSVVALPTIAEEQSKEERQQALRNQKQQAAEKLGLKSGDHLVNVASSYAEQHPEVVIKVGDYYYRAPVSAKEAQSARYRNLSSAEQFKLKIADLQQDKQYQAELATLEKYKNAQGYDITGALTAGVSTKTLNKVFGKSKITKLWTSLRESNPEVAEKLRAAQVRIQPAPPLTEIAIRGQAEAIKAFETKLKETSPELYALYKKDPKAYETEIIRLNAEFDNWIMNDAPAEIKEKYVKAGKGVKGYEAINSDLNTLFVEYTKYDKASREYVDKGWTIQTSAGPVPDLLRIMVNNKKATGVYANDITTDRLKDIGYTEKEIKDAETYLKAIPQTYQDYIGQYGSAVFEKAYETGNLPFAQKTPKDAALTLQDLQTFMHNTSKKVTKNIENTLGSNFASKATIVTTGAAVSLVAMPGMMAAQLQQLAQSPTPLAATGQIATEMVSGIGDAFGTVLSPAKLVTAFNTTPFELGGQVLTVALVAEPFVGPTIRAGQFSSTITKANYVPLRSMSMEAQTARVPFSKSQLLKMRKAGVTEAEIIAAGTKINEQLVAGVKVAQVKLGGVLVKVKNVPYQKSVGLSLFNSTPDITLVTRGEAVPIIKEFYTAAKAAIEPMERSYLEGQRATKPGIIEVRISDPEIISKIMPQRRLISGGKTLEPEAVLPSLEQLKGMGYYLQPIPGKAGRGTTFDATLGMIEIRRFTLAKAVEHPTGLIQIKTGLKGNGGVAAIGDLHGTTNFKGLFNDLNSAFGEPVVKGNPNNPSTWHWISSQFKNRTVVVLGDSIDRGISYNTLRQTFNRLHDEAKIAGDKVERLIGNHELAYVMKDAIKGIKYTDKIRASIIKGILDDIKTGKVKAASEAENTLFTHAGVSLGTFKEFKGKSAAYIAEVLNKRFLEAVEQNSFNDKIFNIGRVEKGHTKLSLQGKLNSSQGGIFWLRPQEATATELNLGFKQVVGHNPGFAIRRIWNENFVEADIGRRQGKTGVYVDSPYLKTLQTDIITESLGGKAPNLNFIVSSKLKLAAVRDTVADVFLGWDGRIYAIEKIKANREAVKTLVKSLDKQIKERKQAGDSIGVKYLKLQKRELQSPTGSDYLYGGIAFWRDIVMGRQNSVSILGDASKLTKAQMVNGVKLANLVRNRLDRMSNQDLKQLFDYSKADIQKMLDTAEARKLPPDELREYIASRLTNLRDIVDNGLDRSVVPYLDRNTIIDRYSRALSERANRLYYSETPYELNYAPRESREGVIRAPRTPRTPTERTPVTRTPIERVPEINVPRTPRTPQTPRVPSVPPPYPPPVSITKTPPPLPLRTSRQGGSKTVQNRYEGAVAWAQGQLIRKDGKLITGYRIWKYPYRQEDLEWKPETDLPEGIQVVKGIAEAGKTIQQFRGNVSPGEAQQADIGAFVARVERPTDKPGSGQIKFTRDNPESWKKLVMHTTLDQLIQIVFKPSSATAISKGMSSAMAKKADMTAKQQFAKSRLAEKLEDTSHSQIVSAIEKNNLSSSEKKELLKMLPDRSRSQVEVLMSNPTLYAPTRGTPKAEYSLLKRKKGKNKAKVTAPELRSIRL